MNHTFSIFLLLLVSVFFAGCEEENICGGVFTLDNDALSEEAKGWNPYESDAEFVVFLDEADAEVRFRVETNFLQTNSGFVSGPCPENAAEDAIFQYESEFFRIYLEGVGVNFNFHIDIVDVLKPNPDNASGELLRVWYSQFPDDPDFVRLGTQVLEHSINVKDDLGFDLYRDRSAILPQFDIRGTIFDDVVVNNWDDISMESTLEVYFQQEAGLVGFNDIAGNDVYVFDRVE